MKIKIDWSVIDAKIDIDVENARLRRNRKLKKIFK